ncbi:uncharacterized protein [Clytia hemisphaerica]|uniref:Protein NO VEIN C-terminal domain-containing protein n=1 Tax=Clytia hemisphaerica TaxID=252671 RepID=A0A7M5VD02_9CNID
MSGGQQSFANDGLEYKEQDYFHSFEDREGNFDLLDEENQTLEGEHQHFNRFHWSSTNWESQAVQQKREENVRIATYNHQGRPNRNLLSNLNRERQRSSFALGHPGGGPTPPVSQEEAILLSAKQIRKQRRLERKRQAQAGIIPLYKAMGKKARRSHRRREAAALAAAAADKFEAAENISGSTEADPIAIPSDDEIEKKPNPQNIPLTSNSSQQAILGLPQRLPGMSQPLLRGANQVGTPNGITFGSLPQNSILGTPSPVHIPNLPFMDSVPTPIQRPQPPPSQTLSKAPAKSAWKDTQPQPVGAESVPNQPSKLIQQFPMYNDMKLAHILYCQLRVLNMFKVANKKYFRIDEFTSNFLAIYHEDFFRFDIMREFVQEANQINFVHKFITGYCDLFLDNTTDKALVKFKGDSIDELSFKLFNNFCDLFEKVIKHRENERMHEPTPSEQKLLGSNKNMDVHGRRHALAFKDLSSRNHNHPPTIKEVGQRVNLIRKSIARRGDAVNYANVSYELCKYYNVQNVSLLRVKKDDGRPVTLERDIQEINDIIRLQAKVNAFIQAFVTFRNICTLHELEQNLSAMEEKSSFDELNLGPLSKQELVYEYFKFPSAKSIPSISTLDVFKSLRSYTRKHYDKGGSGKIEFEGFLNFFIEKNSYDTPFETGIKIQSIGLAVQVVGKASSFEAREKREALNKFQDSLLSEMDDYLSNSTRTLFDMGSMQALPDHSLIKKMTRGDFTTAIRKAVDAIGNITHGHDLLRNCHNKEVFRVCKNISELLMKMAGFKFSSRLLQLALVTSVWRKLGKDDVAILLDLGFVEAAKHIVEKEVKNLQQNTRKTVEAPKSEVKKNIKECLLRTKSIQLKDLWKIEDWVVNQTENPNIKSFDDFGHGSFVKFLLHDKELVQMVQSRFEGQTQSLGGSHGYSKEDIKDFVLQCSNKTKNKEEITKLVKYQFHLDTVDKTIQELIDQSINKGITNSSSNANLHFIHSLLSDIEYDFNTIKETKDGHFYILFKKELIKAPFMVDIADSLHWDTLYSWKLSNLKETLKRTLKDKDFDDITFLEYQTNKFLKVSKILTTEDYNKALKKLDSDLAAHVLVSIIVASDGVKDAPISLLENYTKTTFLRLSSEEDTVKSDDILKFTLACFEKLPLPILSSIANKLFMSPLEQVYGSQNVPELLLKYCKQHQDQANTFKWRRQLHILGYQLSIQEWILDHEVSADEMIVVEQSTDPDELSEEETITDSNVERFILVENAEDEAAKQNTGVKDSPKEATTEPTDEQETGNEKDEEKKEVDVALDKIEPRETKEVLEIDSSKVSEDGVKANLNEALENNKDQPQTTETGEVKQPSEDVSPSQEPITEIVDEKSARLKYCKHLIEDIREKQFGVGVQFGIKGQEMLKTYREREGRSLDRLSKELYTQDSHFVLELIQNADDNEYEATKKQTDTEENTENMDVDGEQIQQIGEPTQHVDQEKPTVAFIVESGKVTVLNNERGFQEKNIRALCDVGKSTKGIHRKGYIGQKGIGFKSVFRVTDAPEIHSNGFHIKFDASKGPNGYILPEWIEEKETEEIGEEKEKILSNVLEQHTWRTKIVLPLKEEMQMEKLTSRFHDIDPSLLMFLNRLHTIVIDDRVTGTVKVMSKSMLGNDLVELSENGNQSKWFVVTKEIPISVRPDVTETDVSVAFPIDMDKKIPQKVFAFLPLRSYGFKFIIQADFEVPSSREDIDKDSAWNQFILDKIPTLVLEAFNRFKNHSYFDGLEGVITFFKFLEHQDHILGIFKRVQTEILRRLQQIECLPVLHGEITSWALPSNVVTSKYDNSDVITSQMLKEFLGLTYIHPAFKKSELNEQVLQSLGVSQLSLPQLVEMMKRNITSSTHDGRLYEWIGRWMCSVATLLRDECDFSDDTRDLLRTLKMVPINNGTLASLDENVIFFPVDDHSFLQKKNKSQSLKIIEQDICMVSSELTSNLEEMEQLTAKRFLKNLGVKSITPGDLINDYIIPAFKSGAWKEKQPKTLTAYVHYLCEQYHISSNIFDVEELKSCIVLKTNKGMKCPSKETIYLTRNYGNNLDLKGMFSACDWTLIDDAYLHFGTGNSSSKLSMNKWKEFLQLLGLQLFTTLKTVTKTLHKSDLPTSPWKRESETWERTEDDNYVIHDLVCKEFDNLLKSTASDVQQQMNSFAHVLDKQWNEYFAERDITRPTCGLYNTKGEKLRLVYSSFFLQLRFAEWVCASNSSVTSPYGLYTKNDEVYSIMADKALYIDLEKPIRNPALIQAFGLKTSLTFEDFIKEFHKWRQEVDFRTSLHHMNCVYNYLRHYISRPEYAIFRSELLKAPFIFLPGQEQLSNRQNPREVTGQFYTIDQVCWEDPTGLIGREVKTTSRRVMNNFYFQHEQNLRDFFMKGIGVQKWPPPQEYLGFVHELTQKTVLPDPDVVHKILRLFQILGSVCIEDDMKQNLYEWRVGKSEENLKSYQSMGPHLDTEQSNNIANACKVHNKIFPTHQNRFTGINGLPKNQTNDPQPPIVVFNKDLAKVFEKNEHVDFIFVDDVLKLLEKFKKQQKNTFVYSRQGADVDLLKILFFFKACGLKPLTELYLPPDTAPEQIAPGCYRWEKRLYQATSYIQQYLHHKYQDQYKRLQALNFADYLRKSIFFTAQSFEVVYRLANHRLATVTRTKPAHVEHALDEDEGSRKATIYVIKEKAKDDQSDNDIIMEIVKLFVPNHDPEIVEDLFDFWCSLMVEDSRERFMTRRRIPNLPKNEVEWKFPRPADPFVPPPVKQEIKEEPDQEMTDVSKQPTPNKDGGERLMTSWPPRNPNAGGGGFVPKPDSLKKQEQAILEKWNLPEAPSNSKTPDSTPSPRSTSNAHPANSNAVRKETESSGSVSSKEKLTSHPAYTTTRPPGAVSPRLTGNASDGDSNNKEGTTEKDATQQETKSPRETSNKPRDRDLTSSSKTSSDHSTKQDVEQQKSTKQSDVPSSASGSHRTHSADRTQQPDHRENDSDRNDQTPQTPTKHHHRSGPDDGSAPNTPSKFNVDRLPTYTLASEYKNISYSLPKDVKKRISRSNLTSKSAEDDATRLLIGQIGELIVHSYFQGVYSDQIKDGSVEIKWLNEGGEEKGAPYDIIVKHKNAKEDTCPEIFIEVKTTVGHEEKEFEISSQQMRFAFESGPNFHLYRVSGLLASDFRLRSLVNLASHMDKKSVKTFMVL